MLVKRKEEFDLYQEQSIPKHASPAKAPKLDVDLRSKCLLLVALVAAMAIFTTVRSEMIVRAGYALVQTKAQATAIEKSNEHLKLEIAKLKSPQRIKAIAVTKLQMIVPEEAYFASKSGNL